MNILARSGPGRKLGIREKARRQGFDMSGVEDQSDEIDILTGRRMAEE
jgi:hypothetical protein